MVILRSQNPILMLKWDSLLMFPVCEKSIGLSHSAGGGNGRLHVEVQTALSVCLLKDHQILLARDEMWPLLWWTEWSMAESELPYMISWWGIESWGNGHCDGAAGWDNTSKRMINITFNGPYTWEPQVPIEIHNQYCDIELIVVVTILKIMIEIVIIIIVIIITLIIVMIIILNDDGDEDTDNDILTSEVSYILHPSCNTHSQCLIFYCGILGNAYHKQRIACYLREFLSCSHAIFQWNIDKDWR